MIYKVTFFDYWHLGSGVSAGAALDSTVTKTKDALPYIPGKTIKGLLSEMVSAIKPEKVQTLFGEQGSQMGELFFSNAMLDDASTAYLHENPTLKKHLYAKVTSTRIDKNGIADDNSLREIEVVVPLTLSGEIVCAKEDETLIKEAMSMIKQMGLNRNRGLGRCQIMEVDDDS